ncbi:unnamed protein product [Mytilus edulis]|uniref:Uncharacterized protein n=1 Tax=Mytilus edulis TaxID=6550 RepID=A0A8S3TZZ2_MYTED|nr:unnamed protein product [Mytilus edulis]
MWRSVIFNIKQREHVQNVAFFIDTEGTCKNYASNFELYQADCDYSSRKFYLTFNNVTENVDGVSLSCVATYKMPSETDRANTEIDVQSNSRCCPNHLLGNYFTQESISKIPEVNNTTLFNRSDITDLLDRVRGTLTLNGKLNFDCAHSLSEEDYQRLTGLTRNQFEAVANTVTDLRKSEIRSVKTCLAILLVKLRTGLSNSILATCC